MILHVHRGEGDFERHLRDERELRTQACIELGLEMLPFLDLARVLNIHTKKICKSPLCDRMPCARERDLQAWELRRGP